VDSGGDEGMKRRDIFGYFSSANMGAHLPSASGLTPSLKMNFQVLRHLLDSSQCSIQCLGGGHRGHAQRIAKIWIVIKILWRVLVGKNIATSDARILCMPQFPCN